MKRRDFVVRAGALALAPGALAACADEPAALTGWDAVRASFVLREGDRNFTAWWFATHPEALPVDPATPAPNADQHVLWHRAPRKAKRRRVGEYPCRIHYWRHDEGDVYASRHTCTHERVTVRFYGMV